MAKNKPDKGGKKSGLFFGSGITLVLAALLLLGILVIKQRTYIETETKARASAIKSGPSVYVVVAKQGGNERTVVLSGEARPYAAVTLFAKVSGYLKEIKVDKGDLVEAGQLLAVIESPEIDRQYDAALADARNKRAFAERQKMLVGKGYISRQDADDAEASAMVAEENANALNAQKGYEILRAPFSGKVTARFADPGALVQSAVNAQTTALPVVALSQTERLRIYVYLDQKDAAFVRIGDSAEISDPSRPEVRLPAAITRISGELDPKTRTLLTEIDLENRQDVILPGSFVQVSLRIRTTPAVEIPAESLLVREGKDFIGVVSPENRVDFRPVTILESDGKVVKISAGLIPGEKVVLNPGAGIDQNQLVQPVSAGEGK